MSTFYDKINSNVAEIWESETEAYARNNPNGIYMNFILPKPGINIDEFAYEMLRLKNNGFFTIGVYNGIRLDVRDYRFSYEIVRAFFQKLKRSDKKRLCGDIGNYPEISDNISAYRRNAKGGEAIHDYAELMMAFKEGNIAVVGEFGAITYDARDYNYSYELLKEFYEEHLGRKKETPTDSDQEKEGKATNSSSEVYIIEMHANEGERIYDFVERMWTLKETGIFEVIGEINGIQLDTRDYDGEPEAIISYFEELIKQRKDPNCIQQQKRQQNLTMASFVTDELNATQLTTTEVDRATDFTFQPMKLVDGGVQEQ